jgi:hypothetical protein
VTESAGLKFMLKQCAVYFGFEEGDLAQTAFVPVAGGAPDPHAGHNHAPGEGHDHDHGHEPKAGG